MAYRDCPSRSFSASPPSSPSLGPADSSPPSSPEIEPIIVDSDAHLTHPFAASVKATRPPPQHEKKPSSMTATSPASLSIDFPSEPPRKKYRVAIPHFEDDGYMSAHSSFYTPPIEEFEDKDMEIWDAAITKVVDSGHGALRLSDHNLSYIPERIQELANFVAIPETSEQVNASRGYLDPSTSGGRLFTRVTTAPPGTSPFAPRSFGAGRTKSIADAYVGLAREHLQLYLASNQIQYLPRELFSLKKMTVLILRNNRLTVLPPEIANLTSLQELNVASNLLRYLPSEMLGMKLRQVVVHPNPFIQPPAPAARPANARSMSRANSLATLSFPGRQVSPPTHRLSRVTPLVELCFRVLFSKYKPCAPEPDLYQTGHSAPPDHPSTLEAYYPLPLEGWQIPEPLQAILDACVPGSVSATTNAEEPGDRSQFLNDRSITGIGTCCSPRHGHDEQVFAWHAEERYTWEHNVAGVSVGGAVPVLWRGCQWGCLDFLDTPNATQPTREMGTHHSSSEDVDMHDESPVVQVMSFASGGFVDFDD